MFALVRVRFFVVMVAQTHLIGYDYSVYIDLFAVFVALCIGMVACSVWLAYQKRSPLFIGSAWGGFLVFVLLGTLGMSIFVHAQRLSWSDYCSKLVAYYADVINRLDHWKIQPGNPEVFSDWSPPFLLLPGQQNAPLSQAESITDVRVYDYDSILEQLAIPGALTARWQNFQPVSDTTTHIQRRNQWAVAELTQDSHAFDRSTGQIFVQWETVPHATTYRLQWKDASNEVADWTTAYTGSRPFCTLTVPVGVSLALRVRAEDGTPEDDPHFNKIVDTLYFPAEANIFVGYAYTMRFVDHEYNQFIVAPIADGNKNGVIDPNEVPSDIGVLYPTTHVADYVRKHRTRAMDFEIFEDQWGQWFIIAEPLWTPDNELEGLLAMDFRADAVLLAMFYERIYPLCLFVLAIFVYFGAVLFVSHVQVKAKVVSRLAEDLQYTVAEANEAKRAAEEALRVKTLFLANMSHEFRTPLNAILGFIGILERSSFRCVSKEKAMCLEAIAQVKNNGNSLLKLVDNLLGVAAMDDTQTPRLKFTSVHLRNLIHEVADMVRSRVEHKSLAFTVEESQDMPEWIKSDPKHIRQVLVLLVDNAIKFTKEGSISIRYGISPEQQTPNIPMFYVSVNDTGIGINPDHLQGIFKPFSQSDSTLTRAYGGAGIGLAVAQQAAEMLNGSISVESQLGCGSTFTFTFTGQIVEPPAREQSKIQDTLTLLAPKPIQATAPANSDIQLALGVAQPLTGCRILVVDDTSANQIVIGNRLEVLGALVETAENGQVGVDKIREAETRGEPFDVILMDLQMPAMDGYKAIRRLRAFGYFKPIIAITAHTLTEDREKALDAGCDEYITKPVDFARLTGVIKALWK